MFDLLTGFWNLIEYFVSRVVKSNFTLNTIWFACVFAVHKFFRSYNKLTPIYITENVRSLAELLTLNNSRIEPRRITLVHFSETAQVDKVLHELLRDMDWFPVLGLDCEMKPRPQQAPLILMMQFANRSGDCVLLRFPRRLSGFSRVFLNIITDPYLWKVGVGVYDDLQNFSKNYPNERIIPQGTFDLRILAEDLKVRERGLKKMGQTLLGADIQDERLQNEQWDAAELTAAQIKYAATDAMLGVALFEKFFEMSLRKIDATVQITEELKKQEMSNFLHKYFDKKSQKYRERSVTNNLVYLCDWLSQLVFGQA